MKHSDSIKDLIRLVSRSISILEKQEMACCGVTISQCHAILEIGQAGEISLIELADILSLDKSTMSRTLNNLVDQGYASRLIDDNNRRYIKIALTENGKHLYDKINDVIDEYCNNILGSISAENRDDVINGIMILLKAFKEQIS